MKTTRTVEAMSLGAVALMVLGAAPAGAQQTPDPAQSDPVTVAGRTSASASVTGDRSVGLAPRTGSTVSAAGVGCRTGKGISAGVNDYFCATARAYLDTMSAWTRSQIPNDYAVNDRPGIATTTVRVYGTDWLQTENGASATSIKHTDQMTCTGVSLAGVSVSGGGASASTGITSATASRSASVDNTWFHQFFYNQDAHWRCKASNLGPAKVTRRSTGSVNYKNGTTSPVAEYSFWF